MVLMGRLTVVVPLLLLTSGCAIENLFRHGINTDGARSTLASQQGNRASRFGAGNRAQPDEYGHSLCQSLFSR